jgi:diadenosine tetraphosphate (Ap4A) HIT family hydrolase
MRDFLSIHPAKILYRNDHFFIIEDGYPVSPGHLLIISNIVRTDYFSLTEAEKHRLIDTIVIAKSLILDKFKPDGFNIGMNCGAAAGQTVFHFHCHVIPRYKDDMENPDGGVRYCIPKMGNYKIHSSLHKESED